MDDTDVVQPENTDWNRLKKDNVNTHHMKWPLAALCVGAATAGRGSWDGTANSIHFYSDSYGEYGYNPSWKPGQTERHFLDLGRAPQRTMLPNWNNEMRRGFSLTLWDRDWDTAQANEEARANRYQKTIERARNLEVLGRYRESLRLYEQIASGPALVSFVRDRRELLTGRRGKPTGALAQYLRARYIKQFQPGNEGLARQIMDGVPNPPPWLAPHVQYAQAGDGHAYWKVAQAFPNHPRGDAARLMTAVKLLEESSSPTAEDLALARKALKPLLSDASSPYRWRATGWNVRIDFLKGHIDLALKGYFRQLEISKTDAERFDVYESIAVCYAAQGLRDRQIVAWLRQRPLDASNELDEYGIDQGDTQRAWGALAIREEMPNLTSSQMARLLAKLRSDQELLASYISFRIEDTELSLEQERNLAQFATAALENFARPKAEVLARTAQIQYNTGQYARARKTSERGMRAAGPIEGRERARYVHAASLARLNEPRSAMALYRRIEDSDAPSYLRQAAMEARALLEEHHGDPVQAALLYRQLEYGDDVAYLVDAKLTPEQVGRFISAVGRSADRPVLQYALGMRYLRRGQYSRARSAFSRLTKSQRLRAGMSVKDFNERKQWFDEDGFIANHDPLTTVRDLEALDRKARRARSDEARAQALYDQAAYIYKRKHLLFYSAGLWQGSRAWMTDVNWNRIFNTDRDFALLDKHRNEHECLAHTMRLCREVIEKHPTAKVRTKALYTGGLAAVMLGNLNDQWRQRGYELQTRGLGWLEELATAKPSDPLAKSARKYADEWASRPDEYIP